jgi:hypothetical protein
MMGSVWPCGKVNRLRPLPAEGPRETGLARHR